MAVDHLMPKPAGRAVVDIGLAMARVGGVEQICGLGPRGSQKMPSPAHACAQVEALPKRARAAIGALVEDGA